jgi:hypothetical protein
VSAQDALDLDGRALTVDLHGAPLFGILAQRDPTCLRVHVLPGDDRRGRLLTLLVCGSGARYGDARLTPTTLAKVATSCSPPLYLDLATSSLAGVQTVGLPLERPRDRAAAKPAMVLSLIRSLSNSESAPKRWNVSSPPGVLVSMLSVRDRKVTSRLSRSATTSIK